MPELTASTREAAYQRVAAALAAIGTPVERNRRAPIEPRKIPILILRDAGHTARQDDEAGLITYLLAITVEGYVATSEASLGLAVTGLHARVGLSIMFITHDLRVAAQLCDEVAVMQNGLVVDHGPTG